MSELLDIVKQWKEEIERLNKETDKKIEEFLKMSEKSKSWRNEDE
tara:strand:+ start:247 stop:381 length:135 start_codon:yes stop_codon:yes gene_type:complete